MDSPDLSFKGCSLGIKSQRNYYIVKKIVAFLNLHGITFALRDIALRDIAWQGEFEEK